jgi:cytochrome c
MRIHGIGAGLAGLGVVSLVLAGAIAGAQTGNVPDGKQLYMDNCSICHGVVTTGSSHQSPMPVQVAWAERPAATLTDGASSLGVGQREARVSADPLRVAIAPPYGPTLRGVIGRPAGTVPGFMYSEEFKRALDGVIWTPATLDIWITDSQGWVPGSVMFYKQPDSEVRRKIITYLESTR